MTVWIVADRIRVHSADLHIDWRLPRETVVEALHEAAGFSRAELWEDGNLAMSSPKRGLRAEAVFDCTSRLEKLSIVAVGHCRVTSACRG